MRGNKAVILKEMDADVTLNNGVSMPVVGFGLFKVHAAEMPVAVEAAVDAGYRLYDTAQVYKNERHLADALKLAFEKPKTSIDHLSFRHKCREDVFITSKLHPRNQNYEAAKRAVTESLEQLETEFIDLYLIHWPGTSKLKPEDPMNAENRRTSWEALEEAYKNEKSVRGEEEGDTVNSLCRRQLGHSYF